MTYTDVTEYSDMLSKDFGTLLHTDLNISWTYVDWKDTVMTGQMSPVYLHCPPRCSIQNFNQQND